MYRTLHQVRHPELQQAFENEFQKWYQETKSGLGEPAKQQAAKAKRGRGGSKRGRGGGRGGKAAKYTYDDAKEAQDWLIVCEKVHQLNDKLRLDVENKVAEMLGKYEDDSTPPTCMTCVSCRLSLIMCLRAPFCQAMATDTAQAYTY